MSIVTIIDYGLGNILSVQKAVEFSGAKAEITSDFKKISKAKKIILPGVGAFGTAMSNLKERKLDLSLNDAVNNGSLLFGICLGMQLFFKSSDEFSKSQGLDFFEGHIEEIPKKNSANKKIKIPHIGWGNLLLHDTNNELCKFVMQDLREGDSVYFIHSYMAKMKDPSYIAATSVYEDNVIPSIVANRNIIGCQFHPEKSGAIGLRIIKRFINV